MIDAKRSSKHLGTVLAAVAAITAGVYFFATKTGKKQRVKMQDWVMKAEKDVMKRLQGLSDANEEAYDAIVDAVLVNYQKAKKIDLKTLEEIRQELYGHWKTIERTTKRETSKGKRVITKAVSQAKKAIHKATS